MHKRLLAAVLALLPLAASAQAPYRVAQDDAGRFWFENAEGTRFVSLGVCAIDSNGFRPPAGSIFYGGPDGEPFNGDFAAWQASTGEILRGAGFNTLGGWSNPKLNDGTFHATPVAYIVTPEPDRLANILRPGLEELMRRRIREVLAEQVRHDRILGFFLDNEMAWWGPSPWTVRANSTLLEAMLALPAEDPARRATIDFLAQRYGNDPAAFAKAWELPPMPFAQLTKEHLEMTTAPAAIADRDAFTGMVAERFFSTAAKVMREEAPGVLNLGVRFAGSAPPPVIAACGKHCDVISMNGYRARAVADERQIAELWMATKKPVMFTEFSWRGKINSSGNPNLRGAGGVVRTQAERGANYTAFVEDHMRHPTVLGMHWFAWADQSPQGRFDGENSNYGIVDIFHRAYPELTAAMKATNARVDALRRASDLPIPKDVPPPPKVAAEPGQFPDRPAKLDLVGVEPVRAHEGFAAGDAGMHIATEGTAMVLSANTGMDWGCGVSLFGPKSRALGGSIAHATDLDGYATLVIETETEKPLQVEVVLDEATVAEAVAGTEVKDARDDGESFAWLPVQIPAGRHTFRLPFAELYARNVWGNQAGKRRVDFGSMKGPAIVFSGGQGEVRLVLHSVRLEK